MSQKEPLLTPPGRLVQGSLYQGRQKMVDNKPVFYESGPKKGQPRLKWYMAIAIAKGSERHWGETKWGGIIWKIGHASFPKGQASNASFAWKIIDGDSQEINQENRKWCDYEGFRGHWILKFTTELAAPKIYNSDGSKQLLEENFVLPGDYIQIYGSVIGNDSTQSPGVYLNPEMAAFVAYGEKISMGADPKSVGFGGVPLPAGASLTPITSGFNPATGEVNAPSIPTSVPIAPPVIPTAAPSMAPPSSPPPPPYAEVLNLGIPSMAPAAPVRIMTDKAQGIPYEKFIATGQWTDATLVQHGYMLP